MTSGRKHGIITLAYLSKQPHSDVAKVTIDSIVQNIDGKILGAHDTGGSRIVHELPDNFSFVNMERDEAQLYVYTELLRIYEEEKGFSDIRVFQRDGRHFLQIGWVNGMSDDEKSERYSRLMKFVDKTDPNDKKTYKRNATDSAFSPSSLRTQLRTPSSLRTPNSLRSPLRTPLRSPLRTPLRTPTRETQRVPEDSRAVYSPFQRSPAATTYKIPKFAPQTYTQPAMYTPSPQLQYMPSAMQTAMPTALPPSPMGLPRRMDSAVSHADSSRDVYAHNSQSIANLRRLQLQTGIGESSMQDQRYASGYTDLESRFVYN